MVRSKGVTLMNGISALIKEAPESSGIPSAPEDTVRRQPESMKQEAGAG